MIYAYDRIFVAFMFLDSVGAAPRPPPPLLATRSCFNVIATGVEAITMRMLLPSIEI